MITNKRANNPVTSPISARIASCGTPICAMACAIAFAICCLGLSGCGGNEEWDPESGVSLYDYNIEHGKVAQNEYNYDSLDKYEGRMYYLENDQVTSRVGVDISSHNKDVNWNKAKAQGIDFAFVRLGWRGNTEGEISADDYFQDNLVNARAAGIEVGAYFFSQATNADEAREEAKFLVNQLNDAKLKGASLDLPVVYDLEKASGKKARTKDLAMEQATEAALAFCQEVKGAGYEAMIYLNKESALKLYDLSKLQDYSFWYAEYNVDQPSLNFKFDVWQYTDKGSAYGIDGNVDMNIMFVSQENAN